MNKQKTVESFEVGKDSFRRSELEFGVAADAYRSDASKKVRRGGIATFSVVFACLVCALVLAIWLLCGNKLDLFIVCLSILLGTLALLSVHICFDWERTVVMRLGRFNRLAGPGLFFTIPIIETCALRIDQRTLATPFGAEEALTSDLVPLDVDAVLFWVVWDAHKACAEVEDYQFAVALAAQTALRDAIGRETLANVVMRRHHLDEEIKEAVAEKVEDWGISILSVEIRDMLVPKELQSVLSMSAQADARSEARITLIEAEKDVSELLHSISGTYQNDELALELRKLHLTYEGMLESDSTMLAPTKYSEGFASEKKSE